MKVAVLSDIHGNLIALEEVLKDAKAEHVDKYIVLGDMISDFPATNEVIEKIKKLTPYVIKGNREQYLINYEKTKNKQVWNTIQNSSIRYYYNKLTQENKEYIRNLKEQLVIDIEGVKIRAVHGSLYAISQLLYFDTPLMDKVFNDLEEDILVYGHNHELASHKKKNNKYVVQAGAIGMHNNEINKPQYTIIECSNKDIKIHAKTVQYDIEKLKEMIHKTDILERARVWQNLCYYAIATGEDIRQQFKEDAQIQMLRKYNGKYPQGIEKNFVCFDDDVYIETSKKYEKYFLL